jgi:hypothetical protein
MNSARAAAAIFASLVLAAGTSPSAERRQFGKYDPVVSRRLGIIYRGILDWKSDDAFVKPCG